MMSSLLPIPYCPSSRWQQAVQVAKGKGQAGWLTESQHTPRADAPTGKRQRNPVGGRAVLGEKLRFWSSVFKAESRFLHFYPV